VGFVFQARHLLASAMAQISAPALSTPKPHPRRRWHVAAIVVTAVILILCVARACMPMAVRWYVNRVIDENKLYQGQIGDVTIHLWRGAYSIHDIRLSKVTGNIPVPFIQMDRLDLQIQWSALIHGHIVGQVSMDHPVLNFVDAKDQSQSQFGSDGPWLQMLTDLFPFSLNRVNVHNGEIHFRTYRSKAPVDAYLDQIVATIDDLTNVKNETTPMVTTVTASGMAMDQATFQFKMNLNPFSYRPSFQVATRLLGLDVTKINGLSLAYGGFDFKRGWFDLVIQANAANGQISGYVRPLFRDLQVFRIGQDLKEDNPVQFFWQALVGTTTGVLTNWHRDQFGTQIPFTGDLSAPKPDLLITLGNVLRNAFIRAYLPRIEPDVNPDQTLQFEAPTFEQQISVGD
jgi:uncharacterized protein involved in outer membrane biogenesis